MLTETATGETPITRGQAFWWRLGDNFFRRIVWYAIPVVVFAALGVVQAGRTPELYRASATLSAASNPLVPNPTGAAAAPGSFETAAGALARVVNERLRTDEFLIAVAQTAGLGGALDDGLVRLDDVRASVWASEQGSSILDILAQWNDPQTSRQLAQATVDQFSTYLRDTVGADAIEAERFFSDRIIQLEQQREGIEDEYDGFVSTLPALAPDQEPSFDVQVRVSRFQTQLDAVNAAIAGTQLALDEAQLTLFQLDAEIGQSFRVIDAPAAASEPESTRAKKLAAIGSFTVLGLAVSAAVLLLTTVLDRSVNYPGELLAIGGISMVATIDRPRRRLRLPRRRTAHAT